MKAALLYSGNIRTLPKTINDTLKCFLSIIDEIDLYFSIWDHPGYVDNINSPDYMSAYHDFVGKIISEQDVMRCIEQNKRVNIKTIKIENYISNSYKLNLLNETSDNLAAQYYKILDCYNLLDDKIDYDIVARMRCDMVVKNMIDRQKLLDAIMSGKIVFIEQIWYNHYKKPGINYINDLMWIANKEVCGKACNIYDNSEKINKIITARNQTEKNYGENICYMNLEAEGLANNIELFDFSYKILR